MYFDSLSGVLSMEGHGVYVWSCYGIGLVVIAYNIIAPLIARRSVVERVVRLQRLDHKSGASAVTDPAEREHGGLT